MSSLTVLGGGNTAFAVAAQLTLAGHQVTLCEHPEFLPAIKPIEQNRTIRLSGVAHCGSAKLQSVTMDFSQAVPANDLLLLIVPAYAHKPFAKVCAPHFRPGQVLVLMPGTLGSLEFARCLREFRAPCEVTLAETDTAPYVCRKTAPDAAHIWGVVTGLGLGVFPATRTEQVLEMLDPLFPGPRPYPHVLACGLGAMNPVVHPAGVLLNAGRIEYSRGDFYFYKEGVTPAVGRVIKAVDDERLAIARKLGLKLPPVEEAFHLAGFGPRGSLLDTIHGSAMLTQLRAPGALETRWLTEDVPYGLATWNDLADPLDVATPMMETLISLTSAMIGVDYSRQYRSLADLGIDEMNHRELIRYVETGRSRR